MLNLDTFGKSKAAIALVENLLKLPEYNKMASKVGRQTSRYNRTLKALKSLDSQQAHFLSKLVLHHNLEVAENYPNEIKTFLKNIIHANYRVFREQLNGNKPYKLRDDYPSKQK